MMMMMMMKAAGRVSTWTLMDATSRIFLPHNIISIHFGEQISTSHPPPRAVWVTAQQHQLFLQEIWFINNFRG